MLVTGPDALSFLQALVSADLDAVADGEGVHSLLLTPQGKLDVDFRLLRVGDDAWLDCDPGSAHGSRRRSTGSRSGCRPTWSTARART